MFFLCVAVLWPSFLVAIVSSGLFFSAFDPGDLFPVGERLNVRRFGVYTLGFLFFWAISVLSGIGAVYFTYVNRSSRNPPAGGR